MIKILFFCILISLLSTAAGKSFAIVHTDNGMEADVVKKITPYLGNVSLIFAGNYTPSYQQLLAYDAVLVYSVYAFYDYTTLGNNLANYVDAGKGVVVADFSLTTYYYNSVVGGRFLGSGDNTYYVITPGLYTYGPELTLVAVNSSSPILNGVKSFDGGVYSFRGNGTWVAGATQVATWSNRTPLIGTREINGGRRVDLNFYPPSSDAMSGYWVSSTDGARILANSLSWAANGTAVCLTYNNCKSCASSGCQWCLDTNMCSGQNFTCADRIANPGDCPVPACSSFGKCSTCLSGAPDSCAWCLDNANCVSKTASCRGEINDGKYCSS